MNQLKSLKPKESYTKTLLGLLSRSECLCAIPTVRTTHLYYFYSPGQTHLDSEWIQTEPV